MAQAIIRSMLSTQIKEDTKDAHLQLEKIVVTHLKMVRSETDYAHLLRYFYAYFTTLEQAIAPFITESILADFSTRRKADRLADDIMALGDSIENLPVVKMPEINSGADAMGALYVMEGSVMGGSIIIGMLQKYGITKGFEFFSGYGPDTGKMWTAFIDALNQFTHVEKQQEAIETARATFANFALAFQQNPN